MYLDNVLNKDAFLEGYYDALNEVASDVDTLKKRNTAFGVGAAIGGAAGAAGGTALAIRQGKKISEYSTRLATLKKKKDSGKITPEELKEYKRLIAKTAARGAIGVGSARYAVGSVARGAAIAGIAHQNNKNLNRGLKLKDKYRNRQLKLKEAFLEGYYDALNENFD